MNNYLKTCLLVVGAAGFTYILFALTRGHTFPLLDTRGDIAESERNLIITATVLMLTVVIPVLVMTLVIAWRYRATNTKAKYTPNWEHNTIDELIWWIVPCVIVGGLAVLTVRSSYALDPFKPIDSNEKPMVIQVIALNWKWLFIYPDEHIATINHVAFPIDVPVDFQITADAPMNSFVIPRLAGQIYAMPGMETHLHLVADSAGDYQGFSANFSGKGFADMRFTASALSSDDFEKWLRNIHASQRTLDTVEYSRIVAPSVANKETDYGMVREDPFGASIERYMGPPSGMDMMHN